MESNKKQYSFASVSPQMRSREVIIVDKNAVISGRESDIVKEKIATIELHIKDGDTYYRQQQYEAALKEFKLARVLIYSILYPSFDAQSYAETKDSAAQNIVLPTSKVIEAAIVDVSGIIADMVRPRVAKSKFVVPKKIPDPMPDDLFQRYTKTGFREKVTFEEILQAGNLQVVGLLEDNKPEIAIAVMEDILRNVSASGVEIDPALNAASELNLANSYLQIGNSEKARTLADASYGHFKASQDAIGQAQALHLSAVIAYRSGDQVQATTLGRQASSMLKQVSKKTMGATTCGLFNVVGWLKELFSFQSLQMTVDRVNFVQNSTLAVNSQFSRYSTLPLEEMMISRDVKVLQPITDMDAKTLTYRIPGRVDGWGTLTIPDAAQQHQISKSWQVGVPVGENIVQFELGNGKSVSAAQIVKEIYQPRVEFTKLSEIHWKITDVTTMVFYLLHLYGYVLPVKIGDCHHELGQYSNAEEDYIQTFDYSYLNTEIEATVLWIRLARNAVEWGDSIYKNEDLLGAKAQYSKLITEDGTVPRSFLYTTTALAVPANAAKDLIQHLLDQSPPVSNWEIAIAIFTASSRLQQIYEGLDFYGLMLSPIHTFEYLQSVAQGFAREAIQAEREFVNFKSREEMEQETKRDLATTKAMAEAERDGRLQQYLAALDDEAAAKAAYDLAVKRHADAVSQKTAYEQTSWDQIWAQAAAQALGGREDALFCEISELADRLDRGETIEGSGPKLAAAQTLSAGRKTRDYELQKMQDNIDELVNAQNVALDQWNASKNRTQANWLAYQAAFNRANMAGGALNAFDSEFFTPDTWSKMSLIMRDISRSYLFQAIRIAKLMERAYNFENDTELKVIKNEYGHGLTSNTVGGDSQLLGGDSLLKDIDSFTYHAITNKTRKNSRIKDIISIAHNYPAHFEEFRLTGKLAFETDLYEFDRLHPGFYGQRLEAVELEIVGLLPEGGVNGTLSAGGVTWYRRKNDTMARRVHQVDTMALSDFVLRNDIFLYGVETGIRGLFQGFGLGTTWQVHLPKRSNDFDFRRIFDVRFVLYYTAKFDPLLRTRVLTTPLRDGELMLVRNYGLRYDFPDAWYAFYKSGAAQFTLDRFRLPFNQKNFEVQMVNFRVVTKPEISNQEIELRITGPNGVSGVVKTDFNGVVSSFSPQLSGLVGADPLGSWKLEVLSGVSISDAGMLKLDRVYNIQMGLEYAFEYVEEVI